MHFVGKWWFHVILSALLTCTLLASMISDVFITWYIPFKYICWLTGFWLIIAEIGMTITVNGGDTRFYKANICVLQRNCNENTRQMKSQSRFRPTGYCLGAIKQGFSLWICNICIALWDLITHACHNDNIGLAIPRLKLKQGRVIASHI